MYNNFTAWAYCKIKLSNNAITKAKTMIIGLCGTNHDYIDNTFVGYNYEIDMASVEPLEPKKYIYNNGIEGMHEIVEIIEILNIIDIDFDI